MGKKAENRGKHHWFCVRDLLIERKVQKFAEIGVWKSHLVRCIFKSKCRKILKEYWAVDCWKILEEKHHAMAKREQWEWDEFYRRCCSYIPRYPQLHPIRLTSKEAAGLFPLNKFAGYFDCVFLDASHYYEDIKEDLELWHPLVRKGGIIGGHDYGGQRMCGVKKAVDEFYGKETLKFDDNHVWWREL